MSKTSFCWHCGKKLRLPHFALLNVDNGHIVRVHKICVDDACAAVPVAHHVSYSSDLYKRAFEEAFFEAQAGLTQIP